MTGRGAPSSVALALDVNAIFHAVILKREEATSGYFAFPKHSTSACIGASPAKPTFLKDLYAIFLAFKSDRRNLYLRSDDAFVSYNAPVRLDCYELSRGR
jgi:hypothetical protein